MKNISNTQIKEALQLLDSSKKEEFIAELEMSVSEALKKTRGERVAEVQSAVTLEDEEKQKLESFLKNYFQKDLEVKYHVNQNLVGGFKVTIGDWRLDASLIYQLELLKKQLGAK